MRIVLGARKSNLSIRQVKEVCTELLQHLPHLELDKVWVKTKGDLDQTASLINMEKTNFFTKEIDEMVLDGSCCVGIHSAKDLPDPLPKGLKLIALTEGQTASDSLVMREGKRLSTIKKNGIIGSSSLRRNAIVRSLRPDLQCREVRGTIEERLEKVFSKEIDGLIVAEAALIRLNLTHYNRILLTGETALFQGKLAVISRENNTKIEKIFSYIDIRKKKKYCMLG